MAIPSPNPTTVATDWTPDQSLAVLPSVGPAPIELTPWMQLLALQPHEVTDRLIYVHYVKRCLDILMALVLLLILALPIAIIALVIALEGGGVIFRQTRIGRYGRPFVIYKFRTMIADRRVSERPFKGPDRRVRHKTVHDPRVTPVGRLLRRTSLDELPQLFNILRGEMSLIGPRPELPQIVADYAPWQHQRHLLTPGLTGWWQVQGRSDRPMHENTELDLYYVRNISLKLDLVILIKTIRVVLSRCGAF